MLLYHEGSLLATQIYNKAIHFIRRNYVYVVVMLRTMFSYTQCQIELLFFPLHYFHSFRDGQKINPIFFLQINLFSFCARIEPKLSKLQKTVKIDKRSSKKPCFLIVFRIFSILGSILAQKTTKSKYLSIVPFICHPGHP